MKKLALWLGLASLLLSSCQTIYRVDSNGVATLTKNQFRFPQHLEGFQRTYIKSFDEVGYDVGAGYGDPSDPTRAALTIFVISSPDGQAPSRAEADIHFKAASASIGQLHPGARALTLSSLTGHGSSGKWGDYRYDEFFAGRKMSLYSQLALFRDGNRLVKYRMTVPESRTGESRKTLVRVVSTLSRENRGVAH